MRWVNIITIELIDYNDYNEYNDYSVIEIRNDVGKHYYDRIDRLQ